MEVVECGQVAGRLVSHLADRLGSLDDGRCGGRGSRAGWRGGALLLWDQQEGQGGGAGQDQDGKPPDTHEPGPPCPKCARTRTARHPAGATAPPAGKGTPGGNASYTPRGNRDQPEPAAPRRTGV